MKVSTKPVVEPKVALLMLEAVTPGVPPPPQAANV
tara:strand:+ start:310 stop:414 length:105 start_codon:yes stop_codon:yes gene_type:complete